MWETSECSWEDYEEKKITMASLKLITYNCKGFNISKVPCITSLLQKCDILLLQDTWLSTKHVSMFSQYFNKYRYINVCGMEESVLLTGRPYGRCTILYRDENLSIFNILNEFVE